MSISNQEKVDILNDKINQIKEHIQVLSDAIKNSPNDDVVEKQPRQEVLYDYKIMQKTLENELNAIIGEEG
jgi:hypothetical protein